MRKDNRVPNSIDEFINESKKIEDNKKIIKIFKDHELDIVENDSDQIVAVSQFEDDEHRFIIDKNYNLTYVKNAGDVEKNIGKIKIEDLQFHIKNNM